MKIQITVKGEPDVEPRIKIFQYEKSGENIFFESVRIIKDKITNNLKLNINETLVLFAAFVTLSLRKGDSIKEIQNNITEILLPDQVMIGVPESLRELVFSIMLDSENKQVIPVTTPIPIRPYILSEKGRTYG